MYSILKKFGCLQLVLSYFQLQCITDNMASNKTTDFYCDSSCRGTLSETLLTMLLWWSVRVVWSMCTVHTDQRALAGERGGKCDKREIMQVLRASPILVAVQKVVQVSYLVICHGSKGSVNRSCHVARHKKQHGATGQAPGLVPCPDC